MGEFALGQPVSRFEEPRLLRAVGPHDRSPPRHLGIGSFSLSWDPTNGRSGSSTGPTLIAP